MRHDQTNVPVGDKQRPKCCKTTQGLCMSIILSRVATDVIKGEQQVQTITYLGSEARLLHSPLASLPLKANLSHPYPSDTISMANLLRSAKSGSEWTQNDLKSYNISVVYQDSATFFETPELPAPSLDDQILSAQDRNEARNVETYAFLRLLDLAMAINPTEESAVDDFAVNLFRSLNYTGIGRVARTRKDIPLFICGELRHAKTDVCILDDSDILLLVQEDKRYLDGSDPEPQLIAEATAAFYSNNLTRKQTLGQPPLANRVFPGIIMKGTSPTFFKIPITTPLVEAIQFGQYPPEETIVYAHLPDIPRPTRRYSEGMKPLDNRRVILSCFEAFKRFV